MDPSRIAGIVETDLDDETYGYDEPTDATGAIANCVSEFLVAEMKVGGLPSFLPIQSGVGDVGNAVLGALGANPLLPAFEMYTEVLQDAIGDLMCRERVRFPSTCALTLSNSALKRVYRSRVLPWAGR